MHRLQEFAAHIVVPGTVRLEGCLENSDIAGAGMERAALFENFLWLHLGVGVRAFPVEACREVSTKLFYSFFDSLVHKEEESKKLPIDDILNRFPEFRPIIEGAVSRMDDIFSTQSVAVANINLQPLFQTALLLHARFSGLSQVRQFTKYINFSDESDWEKVISFSCSPDEVTNVDQGRWYSSPMAPLYAGYLAHWNYAYNLRQLFSAFDSIGKEYSRVRARIEEMERWRINLRARATAERFDFLKRGLESKLENEAGQDANAKKCVKEIKSSMEDALGLWGVRQLEPEPEPVLSA